MWYWLILACLFQKLEGVMNIFKYDLINIMLLKNISHVIL